MSEQVRKTKQQTKSTQEVAEEIKTPDKKEELKAETDDLLDEIEELLAATEAQGLTAALFVQQGGQ